MAAVMLQPAILARASVHGGRPLCSGSEYGL